MQICRNVLRGRRGLCPLFLVHIIFGLTLVRCMFLISPLYNLALYEIGPVEKLLYGSKVCVYSLIAVTLVLIIVVIRAWYAVVRSKEKDVEKCFVFLMAILALTLGMSTYFTAIHFNYFEVNNLNAEAVIKEISKYDQDRNSANALDFIQHEFQCCGAINYKDWLRRIPLDCIFSHREDLWRCHTPLSCRSQPLDYDPGHIRPMYLKDTVNYPEAQPEKVVYQDGCLKKLTDFHQGISFQIAYSAAISIPMAIIIVSFLLGMYYSLAFKRHLRSSHLDYSLKTGFVY